MRILFLFIFILVFVLSLFTVEALSQSVNAVASSQNALSSSLILYDPRSGSNPNRAIYDVEPFPDRPSSVAQVTMSANVWKGWDRIALQGVDEWIELSCLQPGFLVGVHFWGDENDGFARVLVDGVEVWQGNTFGPVGAQFYNRLEVSGLPSGRHTLRVEALGQNGGPGGAGNSDVTIFRFSCTAEMPYKLFLSLVRG